MGMLTILTLGLYRFWMKTRLRRWYWSAIRPGGLPLEYTGTPSEKLLGFLMVVVLLSFYVGVVNLLLFFVSFSLIANNSAAYALSFAGVIPLWFFARYRARQYVLGRTRWRGIRFGLDAGAWAFAWLAIRRWVATLLTLGLLWPRMTFDLEKFKTDRTWFGDQKLEQTGDWRMLWPAFAHVVIGVVFTLGCIGFALLGVWLMAWCLLISVPWLIYGIFVYLVDAKRLMANAKRAGDLWLTATPRPTRILRITGFGYVTALILILLPLLPAMIYFSFMEMEEVAPGMTALSGLPSWLIWTIGTGLYFFLFLSWASLRHVMVTLPVWRHYAETLVIHGTQTLPDIAQRDRAHLSQAEGFAEALDLGAAI